jgi:outer membrane protein assembly factor BamE
MTTTYRFPCSLRALAFALALTVGLSGCVHRIGIQQGNFLDREDLDRVTVGMTRVQVRALLGTPMIADPFHQERWDYVLYVKMGRWKQGSQRNFTVYFDEQDKVARIERPGKDTLESDPTQADELIPEQTAEAD